MKTTTINEKEKGKMSYYAAIGAIALLSLLIIVGAVPGYIKGNWSWSEVTPVTNIKQIRSLRQTGLNLATWETVAQKEVWIGSHQWSAQIIKKKGEKPVMLLLQTQDDDREQPQVEWMDINGVERWKTDSYRQLKFKVKEKAEVKARFFRAWNERQTFAVVQWYASPQGGSADPADWFWGDQLAQLQKTRLPWSAVSLQIPIEPLGELSAVEGKAEALAKEVQTALMSGPFLP